MDRTKLIESYLDGSISQVEKEQFEELLSIDQELVKELALHKSVNEAILDEETVRFRGTIRKIINQRTGKTGKFLHAIKYPLAASILLLIALSLWQIFFLKKSPAELYLAYYTPYLSDNLTRSAEQSKDNIEVAYLLYQEGDYESSFEILQSYFNESFDNQTAHYYMGLNAMELKMYNVALEEFKLVEQDPSTPFALHARWYIAMTFLQLNRPDEARQYLISLAQAESIYSEKAASILKKLKL